MLRLTLTGDEHVLMCATVAEADYIVAGSTRGHHCAECDAELWRAPGPVLAELDPRTREVRPASAFRQPRADAILLCVDCARAHIAAGR